MNEFVDKIPKTKEELVALEKAYNNAQTTYSTNDDVNICGEAWHIICRCEALFEEANCWLDEDGEFVRVEK